MPSFNCQEHRGTLAPDQRGLASRLAPRAGNDLSRTLGWGKRFNPAWVRDHDGLYRTMLRVATAQPAAMDFWAVSVSVPQALLQQKPHCLQAVSPSAPAASGDDEEASRPPTPRLPVSVAPGDAAAAAGAASSSGSGGSGKSALPTALLRGGFWNYLSIGLDAQAAHGFHSLRESSPHLASGQYVNMFWYSWFTCASGWFCCAPPLCNKVEVEAQAPRGPDGAAGEWRRVKVPRSVRALVLLNLQSYAGGSNLWGKTAAHGGEGGCAPPSYSDGALELVGLEDGWRAALVVGTSSLTGMHAKRLGQARAVRIKLKAVVPTPDGVPLPSYLQLDGEPWMQHVPSGAADEPVVIEVRHGGLSRVLSNQQGPGRRAMPPTAAAAAAATGGGGAHKASPAAAQPQETKQVAVSAAAASSEAVQLAVVQAVVSDS